ncbi:MULTISPECIES: hypothetical protein [unclassified Rhizobium]|nr:MULTISPECIES: hypothetical protein [unclassified Rhizobium]
MNNKIKFAQSFIRELGNSNDCAPSLKRSLIGASLGITTMEG